MASSRRRSRVQADPPRTSMGSSGRGGVRQARIAMVGVRSTSPDPVGDRPEAQGCGPAPRPDRHPRDRLVSIRSGRSRSGNPRIRPSNSDDADGRVPRGEAERTPMTKSSMAAVECLARSRSDGGPFVYHRQRRGQVTARRFGVRRPQMTVLGGGWRGRSHKQATE